MNDPASGRQAWLLDGERPADTMQVASRLAGIEPVVELSYREVVFDVIVVDVKFCHHAAADIFYRFFRLRPLNWATPGTPCPVTLPDEWSSEAISVPRHPRPGMESQLSRFEVEFAVHTFLRGVEREIDALLHRLSRRCAAGR